MSPMSLLPPNFEIVREMKMLGGRHMRQTSAALETHAGHCLALFEGYHMGAIRLSLLFAPRGGGDGGSRLAELPVL